MTRGSGITWAVGLLALCAVGCGDAFEEGRARELPNTHGLKILDLKEGNGPPIAEGDRVEIRYDGWLKASQKKIEDSTKQITPRTVTVGGSEVVPGPGFDLGIEGMKAGGKRRIFIPAQLGYGVRGAGQDIPANADLIFDVEIVRVAERTQTAPPFDDSKATRTASGLKYLDVQPGQGEPIKNGDRVQVHYTGWLRSNGKKFDSSRGRGQPLPVTVGAGQVIKGWDEGLLGVKQGGRRLLSIPAHLAYGERGAGQDIPPNAELLFEVEVVEIAPAVQ